MKLSDAIVPYLAGLRGRVSESSIRSERERLNQVAGQMGAVPLRRITATLVNQYVSHRADHRPREWTCEG